MGWTYDVLAELENPRDPETAQWHVYLGDLGFGNLGVSAENMAEAIDRLWEAYRDQVFENFQRLYHGLYENSQPL